MCIRDSSSSKGNQFSQQNSTSFASGGVNSILEGLLDTLDLSQKGWTTKLVSRIENALENGGEEIEFNLKPKNLGRLKVSISLNNGSGNVKIITENTFVTNALTQNENHLQKLFNDQGINLEFSAHDDTKYFGSKNSLTKLVCLNLGSVTICNPPDAPTVLSFKSPPSTKP